MIDLPPVWLAAFAALAWAQTTRLPFGAFGPWADWLGAALILAGGGLMLAAVLELRRMRTSFIPRARPSALATGGVFGLTRNPIYLGDACVLLGLVLIWDAVPSLVLVPAFALLIDRRFISGEEARLAEAFPEAFGDYTARVRRWI